MDSVEIISLSNDRLFTRGEERSVGEFFLSNSNVPLSYDLIDQRDHKGNRVNHFEIRKTELIVRKGTPSDFYFIAVQSQNPCKKSIFRDFIIYIHAEKRITLSRDQWPPNKAIQFRVLINKKQSSNTDTAWLTRIPQVKTIFSKRTFHFSPGNFSPFLARLENADKESLIPSDIQSIHYSVFKKESPSSDQQKKMITGHYKVEIPIFPWFLKRPVVDLNWTEDKIGYNFLHFPSGRFADPFPEQGIYTIQYDIIPQSKDPTIQLLFTVHMIR